MKRILLLAIFLAGSAVSVRAQNAGSTKRNQLTIDAAFLGGSVAYARRTGPSSLLGFEAGVSGDFNSQMLFAGRHFSQRPWLTYASGDARHTNVLFDLLHAGAFLRRELGDGRWQLDTGVQGSIFLHDVDFDDDPGFGFFVGPQASLHVGWRNLKFGPQVRLGVFTEGTTLTEFGVQLSPLTARLLLPF